MKRCGRFGRTFSHLGGEVLVLTVRHVMEVMETIAPWFLAEAWDNAGLQVGHQGWHVDKIWIALEPTVELVEKG